MSATRTSAPLGPTIILVAALVGIALSAYYFLTPLTGINGTPGAMLVILSSLLLAIDALILWFGPPGLVFSIFWVLGILGALGTFTAAWFLHAWWLMAASAVIFAGLVVTVIPSTNSSSRGQSHAQ